MWTRNFVGSVVVAFTLLAGGSYSGRLVAQGKPQPPSKFDDATEAAWKKIDARVGWMGKENGLPVFRAHRLG